MRQDYSALLFAALLACVISFSPSKPAFKRNQVAPSAPWQRLSMYTDEEGSSEDTTAEEEEGPLTADVAPTTSDAAATDEITKEVEEDAGVPAEEEEQAPAPKFTAEQAMLYLQSIGAITGRGEFASSKQRSSASDAVVALEASNPIPEPSTSPLIQGRWELVYCSTQLFRSSPFFMAGRAVCETEDQAKQYNWFCDMHRKALAISTITGVRQIVSADRLVSEFEVQAGAVPFLSDFTPFAYSGGWPGTIEGAIVSSADLTPLPDGGWELFMDTVQIKGSNLPGVRQVLDSGVKLESRALGSFLESNIPQYTNPKPIFRTTYLDEQFRISRDQDKNIFVYVKMSDDTQPTDYSSVAADLGVLGLVEGFNKAFNF